MGDYRCDPTYSSQRKKKVCRGELSSVGVREWVVTCRGSTQGRPDWTKGRWKSRPWTVNRRSVGSGHRVETGGVPGGEGTCVDRCRMGRDPGSWRRIPGGRVTRESTPRTTRETTGHQVERLGTLVRVCQTRVPVEVRKRLRRGKSPEDRVGSVERREGIGLYRTGGK